MARLKVFRPDLDDVERLSYGKGATKKRGTGSRQVCHRLNREERVQFELAKQASYLTLNGTGYRKNRKGSPLMNIFRQRCDALSQLCVIIEKRADIDTVIIDFSTLRVPNDERYVKRILDNVFMAKYRALYESIIGQCNYNGDPSVLVCGKSIDVDALRTNPIWAVNERLLTVSCERDVAKSVVTDILKESNDFEYDDLIDIVKHDGILKDETLSTVHQSGDEWKQDELPEEASNENERDDDSTCSSDIDWNDI